MMTIASDINAMHGAAHQTADLVSVSLMVVATIASL
jgi:hypothetical protein